ncbi:DUF6463 family protein [Kribbella italica]|uniref:DUF4064 domain-containing protein n=1 Tax=Kribbella italica TaxID=1540520 RepID=A0A7W9J554_9ACTN|nr:DUF6463 family protein [Kribbella italica]MBB5835703.1 hypothetical protein [Kribbella italica]
MSDTVQESSSSTANAASLDRERAGGRPVVGVALGAVAVVHLAITPVVYADSSRSIRDAGIVGSVDADPELVDLRSASFWYASSGWAMLLLAVLIGRVERREGVVPAPAVWGLAGISLWGLLFMPVSGFLALLGVASYAGLRRRRRA